MLTARVIKYPKMGTSSFLKENFEKICANLLALNADLLPFDKGGAYSAA
jgi:hypothetical protein